MTSVTIELPDSLADEARRRGLLSGEFLAPVLSEILRLKCGAELRDRLAAHPASGAAPGSSEIQEIIAVVRRQFRAA